MIWGPSCYNNRQRLCCEEPWSAGSSPAASRSLARSLPLSFLPAAWGSPPPAQPSPPQLLFLCLCVCPATSLEPDIGPFACPCVCFVCCVCTVCAHVRTCEHCLGEGSRGVSRELFSDCGFQLHGVVSALGEKPPWGWPSRGQVTFPALDG